MSQPATKCLKNKTPDGDPVANPRLSADQQRAIQLLLSGKTVSETATLISKSRETVSRWRNGDPHFIAEINRQQNEMLLSVSDRLMKLTCKAVDVVEQNLDDGNFKAATEVLKLAGMQQHLAGVDRTSDASLIIQRLAEEIVEEVTAEPFVKKVHVSDFKRRLAKDIISSLCKKYQIESRLHSFIDNNPTIEG